MATMNALYIGLLDSPLFVHGVSPNKMFDYMAVGRPIIQAIETPDSPAEEAGCALLCRPGDPEDVATAIRTLTRLPSTELAAMGAAGREYVLSRATYPRLAERFAAELARLRSR